MSATTRVLGGASRSPGLHGPLLPPAHLGNPPAVLFIEDEQAACYQFPQRFGEDVGVRVDELAKAGFLPRICVREAPFRGPVRRDAAASTGQPVELTHRATQGREGRGEWVGLDRG